MKLYSGLLKSCLLRSQDPIQFASEMVDTRTWNVIWIDGFSPTAKVCNHELIEAVKYEETEQSLS